MIKQAGAKKVVDLRLPGAVLAGPRRRGRGGPQGQGRLGHAPVGRQHGDGLLVVRDEGPERRRLRVLPDAEAAGDAQNFAQQLLEQGKKAKVFGGDGSNDAGAVQGAGLVRLELRSGHQRHRRTTRRSSPAGRRTTRSRQLGSFGPPTYGAVQVALNAIKKACDAGKGQITDRRAVVRNVKKIVITNWILGGDFRFSTKSNDPLNAQVLHLPDPVERLVQARRLDEVGTSSDAIGAARPRWSGRPCAHSPR